MADRDGLLRAYGTLAALYRNVPDGEIPELFAREYEAEVGRAAQASGQALDGFLIPEDYYYRTVRRQDMAGNPVEYWPDRHVNRALFMA